MANTLRIKRRAAGGAAGAPASLANAELAFNEQDNTLYYGAGTGGAGGTATSVIAIGGTGAFVGLSGDQTIAGAKIFSSTIAGSISGNAVTATALATARTLGLSGDVTGTASFNGTANATIAATLTNMCARIDSSPPLDILAGHYPCRLLPWRMLPPCFPLVSTVRRWFYLWRDNELWMSLSHALLLIAREETGREASPSAGVIDSQSIKTTESGGPRGFDAGRKVKGRKRHVLNDTDGNLVHAVIHTADIQDRDGAPLVLAEFIRHFPWLRHVFANGGYAGDKLREALRRIGKWTVEIVKRSDTAKGFVVLPRRWVVERTQAWLNRTAASQGLRADYRIGNSLAVHRFDPALRAPNRKAMKSKQIIMNQTLRRSVTFFILDAIASSSEWDTFDEQPKIITIRANLKCSTSAPMICVFWEHLCPNHPDLPHFLLRLRCIPVLPTRARR